MPGFELAFLSALMAASPTTPIPWFIDEDYPFRRVRAAVGGGNRSSELSVDPNGRAGRLHRRRVERP